MTDEELCCFRDLKPGAKHHYLVVPNRHIVSCASLRKEDMPLVRKMMEIGKALLLKHHFNDLDDTRLGFHIPPFYSVPHLHLHVLAPASQMDLRSLLIYGPQSFRFLTSEKLLQKLNS
ncbi:adenosine 5'-monophosphoramidase HINT3-like isoform X2 [Conger conger]|uniref:adenosine 5'-monophosphoramidase HINT3-like isoform X2 n=1 Tax=Conger conger TaxID=82655 RepID=UPI002A5B06E7|nr:adenosine 5'-monophosphoramidase HINT3-like isoform X2 [Conger conger]